MRFKLNPDLPGMTGIQDIFSRTLTEMPNQMTSFYLYWRMAFLTKTITADMAKVFPNIN